MRIGQRIGISIAVILVVGWLGGCNRSQPRLAQVYIDAIEKAVRGIIPDDEKIAWRYIDELNRHEGRIKAEGRFWARLKGQQVAVGHKVVASIATGSSEIESLSIDGVSYQRDQTLDKWWDGIEEYNPIEKFTHLTDQQKNELWWEIDKRVERTRGEASTTIRWSMHDLVQLTARYNVSPREISEFFEYGQLAPWRNQESPAAMARNAKSKTDGG